MPSPPAARDTDAVLDYVRLRGAVSYPARELLADFPRWRAALRNGARRTGLTVQVTHLGDVVVVHVPNHLLAHDESRAVADVVASLLDDDAAEALSYDEALRRRRPGGAGAP